MRTRGWRVLTSPLPGSGTPFSRTEFLKILGKFSKFARGFLWQERLRPLGKTHVYACAELDFIKDYPHQCLAPIWLSCNARQRAERKTSLASPANRHQQADRATKVR